MYGRVVGRRIRYFRASWSRSVLGECAGHEESARTQKRRAGKSVVDEAAHVWTGAQFLSAVAGDSRDANLLAAAQRSRAEGEPAYSAGTEGSDADESPARRRADT